jgi:hypothetical protein
MRESRSFAALRAKARKRLARLRARAVLGIANSNPERDREMAYVVLEAQNAWANFSRSYLISCIYKPRRCTGGRVTHANATIQTPGDVLYAANKLAKGPHAPAPATRRDEPAWYDTALFGRTSQELQCSHLAEVQAALSLQTRVFYDLPSFRNFYAHRNGESAQKAVQLARTQYLITGPRHPSDVLALPAKNRTQALILDWLDDMRAMVDLLCD